jgi:hypothetical protein
MKKGLKTKLEFGFNIEDSLPDLNYNLDMDKEETKKKEIIIIKKKPRKNGRDSSTGSSNPKLF